MRSTSYPAIAALCTAWLFCWPANAQLGGSQTVRFFDSETGLTIEPQQVRLDGTALLARDTRLRGAYRFSLSGGEHQIQAFTSGYRNFVFSLRAFDAAGGAEAMVDPVAGPPEFSPDAIRRRLSPQSALIIGFVGDDLTGQPLSGVRVAASGVETLTDQRGFFSLAVPVEAGAAEDSAITASITFSKDGYRTDERRNVELYGNNALKYRVRLEPGAGGVARDDRGVPLAQQSAANSPDIVAPLAQLLGALLGGRVPASPSSTPGGISSTLIPKNWRVPSSIRVGRDCKTPVTCAAIEVLSLDHYCKRVLPSEWIPGWKQEALKAGSIAVRTYATWYYNSRSRASYDICDNPSCQYFGPRTYFTTDVSVDSTSVAVLTRSDGIVVKTEYSAEANDTGCGDGKTADCIDDPVCAGRRSRGHGRGMCQYGTQRWAAQGRDWRWIVRHYFPSFKVTVIPKETER